MECDCLPDNIDVQWNNLLQKYLQYFSCQNDVKTKSFDEILRILFVTSDDSNSRLEDKDLCEKCLIEALHYFTKNSQQNPDIVTQQSQLCFLLNTTKYMIRDETCLINLNVNNVLQHLIYLTQHSNLMANREIKTHFLDLLVSCLEHESGIKWIMQTKYWFHAYCMVMECQNVDVDFADKGNTFLANLIDIAINIDKELCDDVIKTITEPLCKVICQLPQLLKSSPNSPFHFPINLNDALKPSITCIVDILEKLLRNDKSLALKRFVTFEIDKTCDKISQHCDDTEVCLILERITILLSCFNLTDYFDGIKFINQDPLAFSGIINIFDREVARDHFTVVLELYYYAMKYLKWVECKLPKFYIKGKEMDIETELAALQLEPILLLAGKLECAVFTPDADLSSRSRHMMHIIRQWSSPCLELARSVRRKLPIIQFELFTFDLQIIIKSKDFYSEENVGGIFEGLIYSFDDLAKFICTQANWDETQLNKDLFEDYVDNLLTAALIFQNAKFKSNDRLKALDIPQIMYEFLTSYNWSTVIIVKGLNLMKEAISKRLSPCMSLLIDTADGLKDVGPMLHRKCYNTNWEIRNAVLDVVWTISFKANKSFTSFKEILIESNLPDLVSTMALTDPHPAVQATAFKCLQEMVAVEPIGIDLANKDFIEKVLNILIQNPASIVQSYLIGFIDRIYQTDENIDEEILLKIYKILERVALSTEDPGVKKSSALFWITVARKLFRLQGWMDCTFPPLLFSKRIVTMTRKEIQLRVYKALTELGQVGCLNVMHTFFLNLNTSSELYPILKACLKRFHLIFHNYQITPELMSFNENPFDIPSPISPSLLSPLQHGESEEIIQEMINDTVMSISSSDINFYNNENLLSSLNRTDEQLNEIGCISPAYFVDFVLKLMSCLTAEDKKLQDSRAITENPDDTNNIIDY